MEKRLPPHEDPLLDVEIWEPTETEIRELPELQAAAPTPPSPPPPVAEQPPVLEAEPWDGDWGPAPADEYEHLLPLMPSWRSYLPRVFRLGALVAFCVGLGFLWGWAHGTEAADRVDPLSNYCGITAATRSRAAMHHRNLVWMTWNKMSSDEDLNLGDTPEEKLAFRLGIILSPGIPETLRVAGALSLASKGNSFAGKSLEAAARTEDPMERALAFRRYMRADAQAEELIREILCDQRRLNHFLARTPIRLETLPDGTAP